MANSCTQIPANTGVTTTETVDSLAEDLSTFTPEPTLITTLVPTLTPQPEIAPEMSTIYYQVNSADFPNPERGWFQTINPVYETNTNGPILTEKLLQRYRDSNITLVRKYYSLYPYRDQEIGPFFMKELQADFIIARKMGVKIIPRFVYHWNMDLSSEDAALERVLAHIDQLTPVLQANSDVIDHLQAGFIGYWGEWHDSSNKLVSPDLSPNDATRKIVDKLLTALPPDRMILLRYPNALMGLLAQPVDAASAYNGSMSARLGFHNDGFIYDETDFGTFSGTSETADTQKVFLEQQARFTLTSGEPAGSFEYSLGTDPRPQLSRFRYSSLNISQGDAAGLYAVWKSGGIFEEIGQRLGYRFHLVSTSIPERLHPGAVFSMNFSVQNDGYAGLHNPRPVEIVLRSLDTEAEYFVQTTVDPRWWQPGELTSVDVQAALPADIPAGEYDVFLNLPDPAKSLYGRPEYSIRLANENVWEEYSGYNSLQAKITITADAPGLNSAVELVFVQRTQLPDRSNTKVDQGPKEVNLALFAVASASSVWEPGVEPEKTNDDDMDTRWSAGECQSNQEWYQLDWPMPVTFSKVIFFENPEFQRVRQFQLLVPDGDSWNSILAGGKPKIGEEIFFDAVTTQSLRVYFPEAISCPTFDEIQVFLDGSTDNPFIGYTPPKEIDLQGPVVKTKRDDTVVDFQNRPDEIAPLIGVFQGVDFGDQKWMTANEDGAKYLFFDSDAPEVSLKFSLPAGKVLRGVTLRAMDCVTSSITALSEGNPPVYRVDAAPWWAILDVGWSEPVEEVVLNVVCDGPEGVRGILFDNIVYGVPPIPDLVISFEDIPIEMGKPVELEGVINGIDFGQEGWMLESDGESSYIYMAGLEAEKTLTLTLPVDWIMRGISMQVRDDSGTNSIQLDGEGGERASWSWFPKGWWQSAYETSWDSPTRKLTITIHSDSKYGVGNVLIKMLRLVAP